MIGGVFVLKIEITTNNMSEITDMDAIAFCATTSKIYKSETELSIRKIAGDEFVKASNLLPGKKLGEVQITEAFEFPCNCIIHVYAPSWDGITNTDKVLYDCYYNAMAIAYKNHCRRISFCNFILKRNIHMTEMLSAQFKR